ncbi:MAG: hypothetical protein R3279_12155, partial [Putridiphycobacter sp.]|nr:hypothetical protein [Putridiphycobacter sp.]
MNTAYQDFSLVISGSEAYFASSREQSIINYRENNWRKNAKVNVYKADVSQLDDYYEVNLNNVAPFLILRDEFTHVGPICFSVTGDTMFFTKVPRKLYDKAIQVRKPQLYMLTKQENGKWYKTPQILPFNNPLYVFAHPTYNSSTKTLYFVSDQVGGEGGKDIYSVTHNDGKWAKPINLKSVNTTSDELFPFIANDQTLFFSSNRAESTGGLDVFFTENIRGGDVQDLAFVNSPADDFGIFLVEGKNIGFLSSNRDGNDDLFAFTVNKEKNIKNSLFGKFAYRKLQKAVDRPLKVELLNERSEPVQETLINEDGEFEFFDISLSQAYTIKAKSTDEMDLVLYDSEGNPDKQLLANESGEFVYEMLDIKDIGELNLKQTDATGNTFISGRFLYEDNPGEEPGKLKVNLIAPDGTIAHTVTTDEKGFFDFTKLSADKDYIVKLDKENSDLTLLIFNADGKIVEKLKDDGTGLYLFRQLKVLQINKIGQKNYLREEAFSFDSGIINGDFDRNGKNVDFEKKLLVSVYDENGRLIDTVEADKNGVFVYNKLTGIENYLFQLDQMGEDFDLDGITLKIVYENGALIKEIIPQKDGRFQYRSLEILNIQALQNVNSIEEGAFDLMAGNGEVTGKIKYNSESISIPGGVEVSIFNEKNELQEKQQTDIFGNFKFRDLAVIKQYNIEISEKPDTMNLDKFSIDLKTVNPAKELTLLPNASGSFAYRKLEVLDNSSNLAELDELHESLDLIFSIKGNYNYDNKEGDFSEELKILAFDGNGTLIGEVNSDRFGKFVFEKLPGISTVLFKLESAPEGFDIDKFSLYIESEEGKQLAKLRSGEKGFFVYKPLGFASEIPLEIKEKLNDQMEHAVFGT